MGNGIDLKWVRFAPLGVPFVSDCVAKDFADMKVLLDALEDTYKTQEAFGDYYEFHLHGILGRRQNTREERAEYHRQMKNTLEGGSLPAWQWEISDIRVLSVKKLHWAKDYLWLSLLNTLTGLSILAGFLALIFGGIPSCIRNW